MDIDSLNWGKCVLGVLWKKNSSSAETLKIFPIAAEDTTELSTDEGDEVEATVEGGEVEAVRYNANKYNLTAAIRTLSKRTKPMSDDNGRITGQGKVFLIPENVSDDFGLYIEKSSGKVVDSYTAADGGRFTYTFKALKNDNGNQIKWGKLTITGTDGTTITDVDNVKADSIKSIVFKEIATDGETEPEEVTIYSAGS